MEKSLRILLIEDSDDDTQLLLRALKRSGYTVVFERVETASSMRILLTEMPWDLILCDYSLPRFSALEALDVLKASGLDLPFIIVSGAVGEERAVSALKAGAHNFLTKGNLDKLGSVIERELHEAEIRHEQKKVEQAQQTREELFGTAFRHSPVGICITSLDGKLENVSESFLDMLGYTREELEGKHFNNITHPDDLEIGNDVVSQMMSGEIPSVSFEKRYLHKSGEPIWALVSSSLLRDSSGQPVHFITHILNTTERKRAEEQIRLHAARLKVLADASQTFATAFHDYQEMLATIARQTAEAMNGLCGVRLVSEDGQWLEMAALHDVDPNALEFAWRFSNQPLPVDEPNFVQPVLKSKQPLLLPGVSEDQLRGVLKPENWIYIKYVASQSRLLAPIRTRDQTLGFLIISRKPGFPAFDEHDINLAQDLADRSALAISNARLFKQVQNELRERKQAEERFRLVVESAPNAILLVDRQGRIEMVNSQAEKFFDYQRAELVGLNIDRLVPERFRGIHPSHRQNYLEKLEARSMGVGRDLYAVRKDGSEFPVEIGLTPITTPEGLLVIATVVDITARKQAEEMLQAKNEELKIMSQQLWQTAKLATMGELAASIAHELNNPLATISLRTEIIQAQVSPSDPQSRSLNVIDSEVKRMSSLVANLLQFSRRSSSQISTIRVDEEVTNTLELIQYHLRKNSIHIIRELASDLPLVQADRQQLRQVFLNLFTNAADAMPLGGMLIIRAWSGDKPDAGITAPLRPSAKQSLGMPVADVSHIFVEVSDTGEGIRTEMLERIWEPFYTTKPEGKGTGLGLAICRRIIQEHGGTIEIMSDGIPGKGTTVRLSLPSLKER